MNTHPQVILSCNQYTTQKRLSQHIRGILLPSHHLIQRLRSSFLLPGFWPVGADLPWGIRRPPQETGPGKADRVWSRMVAGSLDDHHLKSDHAATTSFPVLIDLQGPAQDLAVMPVTGAGLEGDGGLAGRLHAGSRPGRSTRQNRERNLLIFIILPSWTSLVQHPYCGS
jgi:hypothetical protein